MDPKSINLFLVLDTEESEPEGSLLANPPLERCDTLVTIRPVAFQMKKEEEEKEREKKEENKNRESQDIMEPVRISTAQRKPSHCPADSLRLIRRL